MLDKGDQIPEFELYDQEGKLRKSEDYLGKDKFVIFFYPMDFTPGCTTEVCSFRDNYEEFAQKGVNILGISADSQRSHHRFANKHNLPFPLLSDPRNSVRKKFGIKRLFGFLPTRVARVTFIIDKEGKILHVFDSLFNYEGHVQQVADLISKKK